MAKQTYHTFWKFGFCGRGSQFVFLFILLAQIERNQLQERDKYNHLRGATQTEEPNLKLVTFNVMEFSVEYNGYVAPMHLNNLIDGYIDIVYSIVQVVIITSLV